MGVEWNPPTPSPINMDTPPSTTATRSTFPSPSKSPMTTATGLGPTGRTDGGPNVPSPRPRNTDTLPFEHAVSAQSWSRIKSTWESELISPVTILLGDRSTAVRTGGMNVPSPRPRKIETTGAFDSKSLIARSGRPSPLKSAEAISDSPVESAKSGCGTKVLSPFPRRIRTLPDGNTAPSPRTARSGTPSILKSAASIAAGWETPAMTGLRKSSGEGLDADDGTVAERSNSTNVSRTSPTDGRTDPWGPMGREACIMCSWTCRHPTMQEVEI